MRSAAALVGVALLGLGCPGPAPSASSNGHDTPPPPSGSAVVLPPFDPEPPRQPALASVTPDASGHAASADAGAPQPLALRPDVALAAEALPRDDQPGVSLELTIRPRHLPQPPKLPEVSLDGIAKAARETALTSMVDLLASGRMRWVFTSRALHFPVRTELRARHDRYGNILLWPSEGKYRVLAPGALRTVLDEARVDVTPLSPGARGATGAGYRLGERTRAVMLESSIGRVQLELATVPEAARGGPLLCRAIVELVAMDPATRECRDDEVPLFATIEYPSGDGVEIEVTSLTKRTDIVPGEAVCPPAGAEYQPTGLPDGGPSVFLTREELAAFRSKPDPKVEPKPGAPADGLVLENASDRLLYFVLDGVAVAAVPSQSSRTLVGVPRGRYEGEWRTLLGDQVEAPAEIEAPSVRSTIRAPSQADAGPP